MLAGDCPAEINKHDTPFQVCGNVGSLVFPSLAFAEVLAMDV
jgi:hypothetical protein